MDSSPPPPWRAEADVYLGWRKTRVDHRPEPGWTPCLLVLTGKRLLPQVGAGTLRQREVWGEIRLEGQLLSQEPPVCRGGCARPQVHSPKGGPGSQRSRAPHAAVLTVLPAKEDSSAHPFLSTHRCSGKAETCQILRKKLLAHSNNTEIVPGFVYCCLVYVPVRLLQTSYRSCPPRVFPNPLRKLHWAMSAGETDRKSSQRLKTVLLVFNFLTAPGEGRLLPGRVVPARSSHCRARCGSGRTGCRGQWWALSSAQAGPRGTGERLRMRT